MSKNIFFALLAVSFFCSCQPKDRFSIDTSVNRTSVKIHRFDSCLISLDTLDMTNSVKNLYDRYPDFLKSFINNIDTVSPVDTISVARNLKNFILFPQVKELNRKVMDVFKNVSDTEKEISDAYTYLAYYFPNLPKPEVYFFVSGLNRQLITDDRMKFIGIGSDYYLGSDYQLYKSAVYDYQLQNMNPQNLAVDLVSALLFNYFRFDSKDNRLLDNMLHRGKVMYLLSVFMPGRTEQEIIGYTSEQWNWAEEYESDIWKIIVSQKHLFSSDYPLIRQYLNDAPFTSRISQESPGRLGTWVGMRIVKSYMNRNKDVTLQQLMQLNEYQTLLEESGYRP